MTETSGRSEATDGAVLLNRAAEIMIRLSILAAIVVLCFSIFSPFLIPILWAAIISVALFPLYAKLKKLVGGKDGIAGALFVLVALAIIIVPSIALVGSIADTAQALGQQIESGTLQVPPPRESVRTWPLIGDRLYETWLAASENLQATMERFAPQVRELASRAVHSLRGIAGALPQTILAIIIASFFPLICPECSGPMRIIAFIEEQEVIRKILEHLKLWVEPEPRPPPAVPEQIDIQYVPFFDS